MRIIVMLCCLCFLGCAVAKPLLADTSELTGHEPPYMIFGIGYLNPPYMVLTLTDVRHQYVTITVARNDSLRVGHEYTVSH